MLKFFNTAIDTSPNDNIIIHGNLSSGRAVEVLVKNIDYYIYIKPTNNIKLTSKLMELAINNLSTPEFIVKRIEEVRKTNFYGYNEEETFFKIFYTGKLKNFLDSLKNGIIITQNNIQKNIMFKTFESTVAPITRFMTDKDINGMSYIVLDKYKITKGKDLFLKEMNEICHCGGRISGKEKGEVFQIHCSKNLCDCKSKKPDNVSLLHTQPLKFYPSPEKIFIDTSYENVFSENDTVTFPPFVVLSYDIEVFSEDGTFPCAKNNEIGQIGVTLHVEKNLRCNCDSSESEKKITEKSKTYQYIFGLNTITCIPSVTIYTFKTEKEMLTSFINFINSVNPDIIIGYNINEFDTPYVADRLKINNIPFNIGRQSIMNVNDGVKNEFGVNFIEKSNLSDQSIFFNTGDKFIEYHKNKNKEKIKQINVGDDSNYIIVEEKATLRKSFFSSRQQGSRNFHMINIHGRLNIDLYVILRKDYKLSSYTLNSVSSKFLGEQKEDLPYNLMYSLFITDSNTRRRIATYCVRDTLLPIRLFLKLNILIRGAEIARVCGIPLSYHLSRGVSIRVFHLLLRKANQKNYIIPDLKRGGDASYEGAVVLTPKKGYYKEPVTVLDFASLYPSIIIANNLCYSTYLGVDQDDNSGQTNLNNDLYIDSDSSEENNKKAKNETSFINDENLDEIDMSLIKDDDYVKSPSNAKFVTENKRRGVLPEVLVDLLASRKKVKKMMFNCTDPSVKEILDARQLAIKLTANSVYGFTGASVGMLPCLPISHSVTSYGREMIYKTKDLCETILKREGFNAEVIYGDTDSVMIRIKDFEGIKNITEIKSKNKNCLCEDESNLSTRTEYKNNSLLDLFKICSKLATEVSTNFKSPIKLEFEKIYWPFLLMSKKRYAAVMYNGKEMKCNQQPLKTLYFSDICFSEIKKTKIDVKGLETVRRDNCKLVRFLISKCLNNLLIDRNIDAAFNEVRTVVKNLYMNKTDVGLLVISKQISKLDYAAKQPHVELAKKIAKRSPENAPKLGDRVPFVIIEGKGKLFEKSEDPLYTLEHNLPIDVEYYIKNQLSKPLSRIFAPICDPAQLFIYNSKKMLMNTNGPLSKFIRKTTVCLECKGGSQIICEKCLKSNSKIYYKHYLKNLESLSKSEDIFSKCWTECQRCQGSVMNEVLCVNTDCDIFFLRKKAQKDCNEMIKTQKKLEDLDNKIEW